MNSTSVRRVGVAVSFLVGMLGAALPPSAQAAWVTAGQFTVGGQLRQIVPTAAGTSFIDPTCGSQGGTSLALVQGLKLAGIDPVLHPLVLVVSCLDSTAKARLNFISPDDGTVLKQLNTTAVPNSGWVHLVNRPDKGDLLGCGDNGALYSIDYSNTTSITDGTATLLTPVPSGLTSCAGLAWDAEADMIYMGLTVGTGSNKVGRVVRFTQGSTTLDRDFTSLPCIGNGLAISGGVLLMSCNGTLNLLRLSKDTGIGLGVKGTVTANGLAAIPSSQGGDPGLGDLACDPVSFFKDLSGNDRFTDAMWSRRGPLGNGVVALEFPAFTCGLPSSSVVVNQNGAFSPIAAGLSKPGLTGLPGELPLADCFDATGRVKDTDGDGLPDCWEQNIGGSTGPGGIDFDGDGVKDLTLCAQVNIDGGGTTNGTTNLTTECADLNHKDLFVEIDYMQFHKPDPQALSQTQSVTTVGVKSVREAFGAAPVNNPDSQKGIKIHFQVDEQLSHVDQIIFTPCTSTTGSTGKTTVDLDTIKAASFGTPTERIGTPVQVQQTLNAKRLAFRYVVFGHDLAPLASTAPGLGSSGCSEIGGDDAVVTLGSFTSVAGHGVGNTDEQAGTLMHEFGHLLGFRHGGDDAINCKPNYRSVMNYNRQFSGNPIVGRRLDYSRSEDPVLADPTKTGRLNELSLNESTILGVPPLGSHSSLGPIPGRNPGDAPYFPSADQIAYGSGGWTPADANAASINWNKSSDKKGVPTIDTAPVSANLNDGSGCTSVLGNETLFGFDDWSNILYRASASVDFAGGRTSQEDLTQQGAEALFLGTDVDFNKANDGTDCGGTINPDGTTSFPCKHRIDIKPSFPVPKIIDPGNESTITIAIFSEKTGSQVWNASTQVLVNDLVNHPLTFRVDTYEVSVKVNNSGGGTCSISDVADPITGLKDGIKDLKCQFPVGALPDGTTLPVGAHYGVVSGFFFDPLTDPNVSNPIRAFIARQPIFVVD
jgi:hypothetical protein